VVCLGLASDDDDEEEIAFEILDLIIINHFGKHRH